MTLLAPVELRARDVAVERFNNLRLQAHALLKEAAALPVPDHYSAQASAAAGLAGIKLAKLSTHPEPEDFLAVRDDVEAIARIVDRLLLYIGRHAKENSSDISLADFTNVLRGATEGYATYQCERAARALHEEREEEMA